MELRQMGAADAQTDVGRALGPCTVPPAALTIQIKSSSAELMCKEWISLLVYGLDMES